MPDKIKIYTKYGDKGRTTLLNGKKVSKSSAQVCVYGEIDELSAHLGIQISLLSKQAANVHHIETIKSIQAALHAVSSMLACPLKDRKKFKLPVFPTPLIEVLEREIDGMERELAPLQSFIIQGGALAGAWCHLCRSVARRVERQFVAYADKRKKEVPAVILRFMNRLSDYLFVLARQLNHREGIEETKWPSK
jgi:cob(I)alamin adenosyltransferase